MIPKKIHYCWFGRGKKTKLMERCIRSWRKHCPDYEIIEWNEDNFDLDMNGYTRWCYDNKKYAFLSDYARLVIVAEHGGIYLDTDVEVVRPIDPLLGNKAFFGFENDSFVATGLGFGSVAGGEAVKRMLAEYEPLLDGKHGTVGCPVLNTKALESMGLEKNGQYQKLGETVIYPAEYFNPYDDPTGKLNITNHTISIHWYAKSWMEKSKIIRSQITKPFHRFFGVDCFEKLRNLGHKE